MADGKPGAPGGNTNSSRDNRLWRNTIQRAIAQGDPERLLKIAKVEELDLLAMTIEALCRAA